MGTWEFRGLGWLTRPGTWCVVGGTGEVCVEEDGGWDGVGWDGMGWDGMVLGVMEEEGGGKGRGNVEGWKV